MVAGSAIGWQKNQRPECRDVFIGNQDVEVADLGSGRTISKEIGSMLACLVALQGFFFTMPVGPWPEKGSPPDLRFRQWLAVEGFVLTTPVAWREDDLAPWPWVDVLVGWPPLTKEQAITHLSWRRDRRLWSWEWRGTQPEVPVNACFEVFHVLPGSGAIRTQLLQLKPFQKVTLVGLTFDWKGYNSWLKTSIRRADTGPGACTLLLVVWMEAW
jgi:hypothetical protein